MTKILVVDVDQTVVASIDTWNNWISDYLRVPVKTIEPNCPYDLREMYMEELSERPAYYHGDLLKFWHGHYTYDLLKPVAGSVEALEGAYRGGWEIVFASHVSGNHHESKLKFLRTYFPFMSAFLATEDKRYVRCEVIIDDRQDILNTMPWGVTRIRRETPYSQDAAAEEGSTYTEVMSDWSELGGLL